MTGLHAWFSAGMSYRGVYLALAGVMAAGLLGALLGTIPAPPSSGGTVQTAAPKPGQDYHLASLLGRVTATATLRRFGERRIVLAAGLLAAAGLLIAITAANAVSPLGIGLLAQVTSLRLALALLILTSLGIAGLATRWPSA